MSFVHELKEAKKEIEHIIKLLENQEQFNEKIKKIGLTKEQCEKLSGLFYGEE